jgi:hypothetical protein
MCGSRGIRVSALCETLSSNPSPIIKRKINKDNKNECVFMRMHFGAGQWSIIVMSPKIKRPGIYFCSKFLL